MLRLSLFVLIALAIIVGLVLLLAARKPATFRIERKAVVRAAPAAIVAELVNFHRWTAWSPWEKKDPDMRRTHSGVAHGVGAVYAWSGKQVGDGRMEVLRAEPSLVEIKLDFFKPFEAHNTAQFSLVPQADGSTQVTWAMFGPQPLMGRVMSLFMDMDAMVGKDFEAGLANLQALLETPTIAA